MEKIVILDGYVANSGDLSWKALENLGEVTVYDRTAPGEVVERANDATAIYTNKVVITDEIMEALPALKFIGVLATGYNNVDIEASHRRGIAVCNVPAYSTDSVAQLVFAHLLHIINTIGDYAESVNKGEWSGNKDFSYRLTPFNELAGMTIGIIGMGNIGRTGGSHRAGFRHEGHYKFKARATRRGRACKPRQTFQPKRCHISQLRPDSGDKRNCQP